jgi:ubiquinol-cytochrome c reductase cytochrome b subunit
MKNKIKLHNPITKIVANLVIDLPTPSSISYIWNWGSILGLIIIIQLVTGILLSIHYTPHIELAFSSVVHIIQNVNSGWLLRVLHANGASIFFIFIYIHIARGILFSTFKSSIVWFSGIIILFVLIITAFLGYVLPWGQISYWGATVITNLISAVPYLGKITVEWLWGGFSVRNSTLNRFYSLHFLIPFVLIALIITHLSLLHLTGSNNPIGIKRNIDKILFHPYFTTKDLTRILLIIIFITIILIFPFQLGDPDNFNPANPLVTPIHIQPEWYFLFAYAILRSIPRKLGGVIALVASIIIIAIFPFTNKIKLSSKFIPINKIKFWIIVISFFILTWIGANPVEPPYEKIGQSFRIFYFLSILTICYLCLILSTCFENKH